jgi:tryptophan halogenase
MSDPIRRVLIVGNNVSAWTAALHLKSWMPACEVRVIDTGEAPTNTWECGESSLPSIKATHARLQLDSAAWLRHTQATFKLGTQFQNWSQDGLSYFLPFGQTGARLDGIAFHQYWLRSRKEFENLSAFSLAAVAAKFNKFVLPDPDPRSIYSSLDFAFHFDADAYSNYLRSYAEQRGAKLTRAQVNATKLRGADGFIESVRLSTDEIVAADLFIDCSGGSALLTERELRTDYEDWTAYLPCDRAVITNSIASRELAPYTRATAVDAGWQWRIPLRNRTSHGFVFCSRFLSDDEATATLLKLVDGATIEAPRVVRFTSGRRSKFWNKNCIALGLAAGCLEPLAATQLHVLHKSLDQLHDLFPSRDSMQFETAEYNRSVAELHENVRDFLIAAYRGIRPRTDFWKECATMPIPDRLQHKLDVFHSQGRIVLYDNETFSEADWAQMLIGLERFPTRCELLAETVDIAKVREQLRSMKTAIYNAAQNMPSHHSVLDRLLAGSQR